MTQSERVSAVAALGFTERQAAFLVLVMLHSGVCLGRHYVEFPIMRSTVRQASSDGEIRRIVSVAA